MVPDKDLFQQKLFIVFLFLHKNILAVPHQGAPNEYPQNMFIEKKNNAIDSCYLYLAYLE